MDLFCGIRSMKFTRIEKALLNFLLLELNNSVSVNLHPRQDSHSTLCS